MGTFLLILVVCFVVIPLFRGWLALRRMRRQAREAYEDAAREAERRRRANRRGGWSAPDDARRQAKRYGSTDGEYVEWEEVAVETQTSRTTESTDGQSRQTVTESQVTDVEWEEIKIRKEGD